MKPVNSCYMCPRMKIIIIWSTFYARAAVSVSTQKKTSNVA